MTSSAQIGQLIQANTELKQYYEGVRTDIENRVVAKEQQIDGFIAGARGQMPYVNLLTLDRFTMATTPWPGFTYAPSGIGDGADNWNFTDEYLLLSSDTDPAISALIGSYKINRFIQYHSFRIRKMTITRKGSGSLYVGMGYSSAGQGFVSAGYAVRVNQEVWETQVHTKQNVHQASSDWGAYYFIDGLNVGDSVYFALPFVCVGIPEVIPYPEELITSLSI